MFFDGKLDAMDLMAIDHFERQGKIEKIIAYVKSFPADQSVNIGPYCQKLGIKLTPDEFDYILQEVED